MLLEVEGSLEMAIHVQEDYYEEDIFQLDESQNFMIGHHAHTHNFILTYFLVSFIIL